jgi:hypothetical protein
MTPEEHRDRYVFAYEAAGVERYADPAAVRRDLLRGAGGAFDELCLAASKDGPEAEDAREKLHGVLCGAFGLAPFDPSTGEGTTETESAALYEQFAAWLDRPRPEAPQPEAPAEVPPPA